MIPEVLKETKVCIVCGGDPKPLSEFNYRKRRSKYSTRCKKCRAIWRKQNNEMNLDDHKRRTRNSNLKRKFGITLGDYEDMLFGQGGKCLICGEEQHGNKELSVDHDHKTGKIRSLLCSRCNTFVGYIESNPDLLPNVIEYIKSHETL